MKIESMLSEGVNSLYRASAADLSHMDDSNRAAWLAERCGKLTASDMGDATSFKKRGGEPTQARIDLMVAIIGERLTGRTKRTFVTPAMEWGLETELAAKDAYMKKTGAQIRPSGFYNHAHIPFCGATPDGELAPDGLIELKCPTTETFIKWRMSGVVPEEHKPQMLLQLACTRRNWVEFCAYDPRIKDEGKQIFIRRFHPEPRDIMGIELVATMFLNDVEALWETFHS